MLHRILVGCGRWLYEQRWFIALFVAALLVRLHWNLVVHPLGDYIYSDMNGYVSRADRLLDDPWAKYEYSAFFPFGTHFLVAGLKKLFGSENYEAISIVYALMGAYTVALAYAVARRASRFGFVPPAVGLLGVFYYPHFSLGGYILSEVPFALLLMGALLFGLRLVDHGRHRDGWGMGLCAGLGALIRPQILLSAALVGLYWIVRRKAMPKLRLVHLLQSAVPVALCLAFASVHLHHHTDRFGLISENGSFNLVFGRCHPSRIESLPDGEGHGRVHFRPPPFLQVNNAEHRAKREGVEPDVRLEPAIADELKYKGYIGDRDKHMEFIRQCWDETGLSGQLSYTWLNMELLWRHNIPWPDSGRAAWRAPATWWTYQHRVYLAIPALLGLLLLGVPGCRGAKMGLVAINLLALLLLAAIYFGGTRHRAPYDFVIIILAFEVYATAGWLFLKGLQRLRARRNGGT